MKITLNAFMFAVDTIICDKPSFIHKLISIKITNLVFLAR